MEETLERQVVPGRRSAVARRPIFKFPFSGRLEAAPSVIIVVLYIYIIFFKKNLNIVQ
jgi:hypothetical protein